MRQWKVISLTLGLKFSSIFDDGNIFDCETEGDSQDSNFQLKTVSKFNYLMCK